MRALVAVAAVLGVVPPFGPPAAVGDTATVCLLDLQATLTPGLSTPPGSTRFAIRGTATCLVPSGPSSGSYTSAGTFAGSCASGTGSGEFQTTALRRNGMPLRGHHDFFASGPFGLGRGPESTVSFVFAPMEGDCLTQPVRRLRVFGQLVVPE